ncbi:hypothetical protein F5884DRAFT_786370 [Xylogone sp. PMI_703]|nr:hypothetical protein F5884DRAFT_786370 [Xylogone sp. PMI_703]
MNELSIIIVEVIPVTVDRVTMELTLYDLKNEKVSFVQETPWETQSDSENFLILNPVNEGRNTAFVHKMRSHVQRMHWRARKSRSQIPSPLAAVLPYPRDISQQQQYTIAKTMAGLADHNVPGLHLNDGVTELFEYFFKVRSPQVFPAHCFTTSYIKWICSEAVYDPAALFAILSYSATLLKREKTEVKKSQATSSNQQIYYKIKAIENLRSKFNGPAMTSALTIYAVLCLYAIEQLEGDNESKKTHLDGLASLVRLRGGVEGFPPGVKDLMMRFCKLPSPTKEKNAKKADSGNVLVNSQL